MKIDFDKRVFQTALMAWYQDNLRDLPWRKSDDPYRIWVSEVMLQQTQVATVIPFYHRFLAAFPTLEALAKAEQQEVLKCWEGLGYYSRARNLHRAAQEIMKTHEGVIPLDYQHFIKLKGVGKYIAAAVQSIAFGQPIAVVDSNVKRVLARVLGIEAPVNLSHSSKVYQENADALLHRDHPGDYNQAIMELGALVCKPRNPDCIHCPMQRYCYAANNGLQDKLPRRVARPQKPEYHWGIISLKRGERYLLVQRPENGLLGGLWEFPTGEWDFALTDEDNCLNIATISGARGLMDIKKITRIRHAFTHFKIVCHIFQATPLPDDALVGEDDGKLWLTLAEIMTYPLPKTHHKFMHLLHNIPSIQMNNT